MESHIIDLRSEVEDAQWVDQFKRDWRATTLSDPDRAMLEYSEKLSRAPQDVGQEDVDQLRAAGLGDSAIHDLVQVISYFNYINRIADGLGTDPEDLFPARD